MDLLCTKYFFSRLYEKCLHNTYRLQVKFLNDFIEKMDTLTDDHDGVLYYKAFTLLNIVL